jgi:RNA polymerase sigma-70 factor (ECF subfamily)
MNEAHTESRPSDEVSDQELLQRFLADADGPQGRRAASQLLGRYQNRVYVWCYRLVRDHERALDMAQEVLLNAYRHLASFAGNSRFGSWLFSIARNRCLSELRRPALLCDEETDPDSLASRQGNPDRVLEEKLGEQQLLALIQAHLQTQEQEALWLRCFEKMPVEAITTVLGIQEVSGARAVLQRARRKLRAALRDHRDSEGSGP